MYVDFKHKVLACFPPKSGCTTFKTLLLHFSDAYKSMKPKPRGYSVHNNTFLAKYGITNFQDINASTKEKILDTFSKVIVVRNPLVRVFSSYREKLTSVRGQCTPYMTRLAPKIIKHIRGQDVQCGNNVTFSEFMEYFAKRPIKDPHWEDLEEICQPCRIKYDHVLRLETGHSDVKFFVEEILGENLPKNEEYVRKNSRGNFSEQKMIENNFERLFKDFENVSQSDFEDVAKYYERSSRLFGYGSVLTGTGMLSSCRYDTGAAMDCC